MPVLVIETVEDTRALHAVAGGGGWLRVVHRLLLGRSARPRHRHDRPDSSERLGCQNISAAYLLPPLESRCRPASRVSTADGRPLTAWLGSHIGHLQGDYVSVVIAIDEGRVRCRHLMGRYARSGVHTRSLEALPNPAWADRIEPDGAWHVLGR